MTLIVLLILAGVSISGLFSEKGLFKRTEDAGNRYNEAKARETLETVLLADAQYEKYSNPKYNQEDFLDNIIINSIQGASVQGDIAIIGEYAYELDRSVPKIGRYVGKASELVFPEVIITKPIVSGDNRTATFTITAKEEKNGIEKIEIWLEGQIVKEVKCNNEKNIEPIIYTATRNGIYTVKAYSNLIGTARTTVEGLVASVEFTPNGDTTYKKEHSTKIEIKETADRITDIKYKWTESITEPAENEFIESATNNSTITGKEMTGKWYLWVLLKTESNKTNICGSEAFYFDNQQPTVNLNAEPISETSFKLTAKATDNLSGIESYAFYIDNQLVSTQENSTYTWNGTEMKEKNCYVIVTDKAGNSQRADKEARTKMHVWEKWEAEKVTETKLVKEALDDETICSFNYHSHWPNGSTGAKSYTANFIFAETCTVNNNKFTLSDTLWYSSTEGTSESTFKSKLPGKYYYPNKSTFCSYCKQPSLANLDACYYIKSVTSVTTEDSYYSTKLVTIKGKVEKRSYWTGEVWKPTVRVSEGIYSKDANYKINEDMNEDGYYYIYKGLR